MAAADPRAAVNAAVEAARGEARALLVQQAEAAWRNWVYGDALNLEKTYVGHDQLFSAETLANVRTAEAAARDPLDKRALSFLRVYLTGEAIGRETVALGDAAANLEVEATFTGPEGGEHPYRELDRLLASNRDHRARVALAEAVKPVLDKLNPLAEQREAKVQALLPSLGYADPRAYGAELRGADLEALAKAADDFLSRTEDLYRGAMDHQLKVELGLSLADARRADLPRFNRAPDLDSYFPADRMVVRLRATLLGLGIDLERQSNIRIDDAPLPTKNPRAVCFNVEVPEDIRLSVKPVGGVTDYQALFHEAGHAEHYAHTTSKRFEFQQLGDNAPTEAYAFLFEGLIHNPLWLAEQTGQPPAVAALAGQKLADFVRASAIKKLYLVRRYAGKLLFEVRAAGLAPGPEQRALYQSTLARAYGFPLSEVDADRYLVDRDDFFYAADYFRAWSLAAQLEARLVADNGPRWWTAPKAGALLKALWAEGNGLTVDEIARRTGALGLESGPLLAQFEAALK